MASSARLPVLRAALLGLARSKRQLWWCKISAVDGILNWTLTLRSCQSNRLSSRRFRECFWNNTHRLRMIIRRYCSANSLLYTTRSTKACWNHKHHSQLLIISHKTVPPSGSTRINSNLSNQWHQYYNYSPSSPPLSTQRKRKWTVGLQRDAWSPKVSTTLAEQV